MKSFLEETYDDEEGKPVVLNDKVCPKSHYIFDILKVSKMWKEHTSNIIKIMEDKTTESLIKR